MNCNWKYSIVILLVALILINPIHVMGSSSEKELGHQAHIAYENGAYIQDILLLKQALKLDPNNPKLLTNLGSAENEISNFTSAISFYRQALEKDPHHIGAMVGLGATLELLDNHSSVTYFKEALAQPTNTTVEKIDRAVALTHLGNFTQALNIVNQLPPIEGVLDAKGAILLYLQRPIEALTIFNQILAVHPNLSAALDNQGIAFAELKNYSQALKYFDKSISLNPKDVNALYNKGNVLDHMGKHSEH